MWFIFAVIAVIAISFLFIKFPSTPDLTEEEVKRPKVEQGEVMGYVLGTYWVTDAQTAWYGDISTRAITVKTGK